MSEGIFNEVYNINDEIQRLVSSGLGRMVPADLLRELSNLDHTLKAMREERAQTGVFPVTSLGASVILHSDGSAVMPDERCHMVIPRRVWEFIGHPTHIRVNVYAVELDDEMDDDRRYFTNA